jgi:predicted dehydrogenase
VNGNTKKANPSVGFIGLGVMGHRMLANMTAHGGFNIARAWDPDRQTCDLVKQRYPKIAISETVEDLVWDREVDVVYIASPPASHHAPALSAAAAGKAIYCEKPLGVNISSSREMVDAVESAGVLNVVNFPFADSQPINLIQSKLADGVVGDVRGVDLRLHFSSWPRDWQDTARWLTLREQGGFIREVVSHYVYLLERLFGPSTVVDANVIFPDDPSLCETHFLASLECGGQHVALAGGAGGVGPDVIEFTIWGAKTSFCLWDWNKLKSTTGSSWQDELKKLTDPRQDGYHRMLDNFRDALEGRVHTMPSFRTALSVQTVIESILGR